MIIHALHEVPPPSLAAALTAFEAQFSYPLGSGRSFRISHGDDYPRFFRSMGDTRCFVVERQSRVVATLAVVIRSVSFPGGHVRRAAYIGDLKCDPDRSSPFVYLRLAEAALGWARPQVDCAFGVVMEGTRVSPAAYTGRLGLPAFARIGRVSVLRFATGTEPNAAPALTAEADGSALYRRIIGGPYAADGRPGDRSVMTPAWLVDPGGRACGRLEDTARAKRLIDSDGTEMSSAHLACFAWECPDAAARLLRSARCRAARLGFPALFVSIPEHHLPQIECALGPVEKVVAPATVYGVGLPTDAAWNINTSEI